MKDELPSFVPVPVPVNVPLASETEVRTLLTHLNRIRSLCSDLNQKVVDLPLDAAERVEVKAVYDRWVALYAQMRVDLRGITVSSLRNLEREARRIQAKFDYR